MMRYWARSLSAQIRSAADAVRGRDRNEAGSPVASARSPRAPAPKTVFLSSERLVSCIVILLQSRRNGEGGRTGQGERRPEGVGGCLLGRHGGGVVAGQHVHQL